MIAVSLAILLGVVQAAPLRAYADELIITLRSSAEVDPPFIELGEIAVVSGAEREAGKLTALRIGIAPSFGRKITYKKNDLVNRLALEGLSKDDYTLAGASEVEIKRAGQTIYSDEIRNFLDVSLREGYGGLVEIVEREAFPDVRINRGEFSLSLRYPPNKMGALPQTILLKLEGKTAKQFVLSKYVNFKAPTVFSRTSIPRGVTVSADLLDVETRTHPPGDALVMTIAECVGLEAKRNIGAGEKISLSSLMRPFDLERNDPITIIIFRGNLRIETTGTATKSGYIGDSIIVRIDETGKALKGTITGENTVVVFLST